MATETSALTAEEMARLMEIKARHEDPQQGAETPSIPTETIIYSADTDIEEPGFVEAHQTIDRRTYFVYATGKILRKAGLAVSALGMGELTYQSQHNSTETVYRDVPAIAVGGTMLLKGDEMVRKALSKRSAKKP